MTNTVPSATRRTRSFAPVLLIAGAAVFLAAIIFLVVSSLVREELPTFEPDEWMVARERPDALVIDTVTVNASGVEEWRFFDFERGAILELPDTSGWDLAFQRFRIIASEGALDLGDRDFAAVDRAPATGYTATTFRRDTINAALDHWYSYSWMTHQLKPRPAIFVIQTRGGHFAKVQFLSYYCTGMAPGCITFRYAYQGAATRAFR